MYQRLKWLRTRYMRRFDNVLETEHIVKLASTLPDCWVAKKLRIDIYDEDVDKDDAWIDEYRAKG